MCRARIPGGMGKHSTCEGLALTKKTEVLQGAYALTGGKGGHMKEMTRTIDMPSKVCYVVTGKVCCHSCCLLELNFEIEPKCHVT